MDNKYTKIIATIGPVTDSEEMIEKLIRAGVNIFRFNFKHNTVEWHSERMERVNKVSHRMGVVVGKLIDLQGPEIRILMPVDAMELKEGEMLLLGDEALELNEKGFTITHPSIIPHLTDGQKLLADDGAFTFHVHRKGNKTYLKSATTSTMKNRKTLNIPGADFPFPVLVDRDYDGLELAAKNDADFVGLSFVRSADDLKTMKKEMKKKGVRAMAIAKIETQKALDHLDAIIEEADGVMIARGDLGVEQPLEQVPYYQKIMIKKCLELGKPVITATQMLQTMITQPFATRAEVSDIANATYDLTDAVMLSGETASGLYPLESVQIMARTVEFNEKKFRRDPRKRFDYEVNTQGAIMCETAFGLYLKYVEEMKEQIAAFIIFTKTGASARLLSRYRPLVPIYAFSPDQTVCEELTISFGVFPYQQDRAAQGQVTPEQIEGGLQFLKEKKLLHKGDRVIVTHGDVWSVEGGTSTIKVVRIP